MAIENKETQQQDENNTQDQNQDVQSGDTKKEKNTERDYWKIEYESTKQAFDALKKEFEQLKQQTPKKQESKAESDLLMAEIERLKNENQSILQQQRNKEKISNLASKAKALGLKENYAPMLDRFIDLNSINLENPHSYEVAVQNLKREMPDLFGEKSYNTPILPDTNTNYSEHSILAVKKQIRDLIKDRKILEAQSLANKYNIESLD